MDERHVERGWTCPPRYTPQLFQFTRYRRNQTRIDNNDNNVIATKNKAGLKSTNSSYKNLLYFVEIITMMKKPLVFLNEERIIDRNRMLKLIVIEFTCKKIERVRTLSRSLIQLTVTYYIWLCTYILERGHVIILPTREGWKVEVHYSLCPFLRRIAPIEVGSIVN